MKNIIAFIFIGLMVASCSTTQEVEVKKPVVDNVYEKRRSSDQPKKKANLDPEQMVAMLGLSEKKAEEFIVMWETTGTAMRKVRREHMGDRDMLRQKMGEVKDQRDHGLQTILTPEQLQRLHVIMKKHGGGVKAKRKGMNDNN